MFIRVWVLLVTFLNLFTPAHAEPTRVIVIGAGVAGLAAARYLKDQANIDVLVVEARDRIGGRVALDESLGVPVDLGASWIHRASNNVVTEFCQKQGIVTRPAPYTDSAIFLGRQRLSKDQGREFWRWKLEFEDEVVKLAEDAAVETMGDLIERFRQTSRRSLMERLAAHWSLAWDFEIENATDAQFLALGQGAELKWSNADHLVVGGYFQVPQALAKGLDIRLNHLVREVRIHGSEVSVVTDKETFTGDYAICTLPLGVLKSGMVRFVPQLPKEKKHAIDYLGMGVLAKVTVRFPKVFWPADKQYFFQLMDSQPFFPLWINDARLTGQPVLSTQIGGRFGKVLEHLPRAEVAYHVMRNLKRMFGESIPDPEAIVVTGWSYDPYSEGSYSYLPAWAEEEDFARLAAPVGRLLFAGEATHGEENGTVHGAFMSGVREAQRILSETSSEECDTSDVESDVRSDAANQSKSSV